MPSKVNHLWQWADLRIDTLLTEANRRLGELNGQSLTVLDIGHFIQMHIINEAQSPAE